MFGCYSLKIKVFINMFMGFIFLGSPCICSHAFENIHQGIAVLSASLFIKTFFFCSMSIPVINEDMNPFPRKPWFSHIRLSISTGQNWHQTTNCLAGPKRKHLQKNKVTKAATLIFTFHRVENVTEKVLNAVY